MLDTTPTEAAGLVPAATVSVPAQAKAKITTICICGSNPATKLSAPFHDPSALIYSCSPDNSPYGMGAGKGPLPRVDELFELHAPLEHPSRPAAYLMWVAQQPLVWMRDARALQSGMFKGARPYPEQKLFGTWTKMRDGSAVPTGDGEFCPTAFTSSISYILAKAIIDCLEQDIKQIALFGILQSAEEEYKNQRAGTQYFLWEARRRGIKTLVAPESKLLEGPVNEW
jgi:hypothetical protein